MSHLTPEVLPCQNPAPAYEATIPKERKQADIKCMMYDVLITLPISAVHGYGPKVRAWVLVFVFICVHGVWTLTFMLHLSLFTDLLCSAWLGTTGAHFDWLSVYVRY